MKNLIILIIVAVVVFAIVKSRQAARLESSEERTAASLPPSVQHTVSVMDSASKAAFFNEYEKKRKKVSVGYLLWIIFGVHYLYARKIGLQVVFWLAWFVGIGEIWWLIDLFRIPSIIRSSNEQMAREALQTLQVGASFRNPPPVQP